MLKIHTRDGHTATLQLDDAERAQRHLHALKQDCVTGFTLIQSHAKKLKCPGCRRTLATPCSYCGQQLRGSACEVSTNYSLSRPEGFDRIQYQAEYVPQDPETRIRGGESIVCFAGDVCVTILAHQGQPAARVTLRRLGKQRYNPLTG